MEVVTGVVRDVADALVALDGIRAVSLGGSRALGMDDAASDTDLYAWYRGPLVGSRLRQQALHSLADDSVHPFDAFGPEDHWHSDGRPFEVVYVDLDDIHAQITRARSDGLDGEVCATAFLHTAYASVPIADPYAELDRLHADLTTFPEATRAIQLLRLPVVANEFASQLRGAQSRQDWPMVVRRRAGLLDVTVSLLFALNRRYHPGEKRLLAHVASCDVRPIDMDDRLRTACVAAPDDPSLAEQYLSLITEIVALSDARSSSATPRGEPQDPASSW
jgi:hypothetical protein